MKEIISHYAALLAQVDDWFSRCLAEHSASLACKSGCSSCCRGLFDITLLDAYFLKLGFDRLPETVRREVLDKVQLRLAPMQELWPEFDHPYLLNHRDEEEWEALMPDEDDSPCVLLGEDGGCLVYEHRPMTCRLHGIPLIDVSGEVMHDEWCTLNFTDEDPLRLESLRAPFDAIFRDEVALFRLFTQKLLGQRISELDTFIPTALLIDFDGFQWEGWLENFVPAEQE